MCICCRVCVISSMCTVSGMLSVIACALPSITRLLFSRSLYSLQSQTLFCRERKSKKKNFFQNHSDKCFFFLFSFQLNKSIHNKLSRKRLRGGLDGEEETSYLPRRKTIKADVKECDTTKTPRSHPGKMKNIALTQSILYKLCFYAHLFCTLLQLNFHFFATNVSKMQQHKLFLVNVLDAGRLMDALTCSLAMTLLSEH